MRVLNMILLVLTDFGRFFFLHGSGSVLNANSDPDLGKKGRSGSGQKDPDPKHCFKGQNIPSVLILKIRTHSVVSVYSFYHTQSYPVYMEGFSFSGNY